MISQDRMEKALRFLAETDEVVAELEGEMLRTEYRHGLVKDRVFLTCEGTIAERQARAESSNDALAAHEEYISSLVSLKKIKAKRATEEQVIQVWRSQESSRRQGV